MPNVLNFLDTECDQCGKIIVCEEDEYRVDNLILCSDCYYDYLEDENSRTDRDIDRMQEESIWAENDRYNQENN